MRCGKMLGMACVFAVAASLGAAPVAVENDKAAAPALKPGEIVIKRTGTRRVVLSAPDVANDRPSDQPGAREVTIGYLVREPSEIAAGPQEYGPASPFLPSYDNFDRYGFTSDGGGYLARPYGYGYGYGYAHPSVGYRSYGSACGSSGYNSYHSSFGSSCATASSGSRSNHYSQGSVTHAVRGR